MKNVDDYLAELLAHQPLLAPVPLPLSDTLGAVTAQSVRAKHPIPLFDNSSMDGYAVYASDIAGASSSQPVTLPVIGDIPAGATTQLHVPPGNAARIMTGAPMPAGADAIVPVEQTDGGTETVQIVGQGDDFIRRAGADVATGDEVIGDGVRVTARHIASAASAGHGDLLVRPRPRVAVIATGSELRDPGEALEFGQIPNSNSALIAASLAGEAVAMDFGMVPDDPDALKKVLAGVEADAVILTGGVSVGAYDVVKELLAVEPGMWFGPVAMQPGKPQGFGSYRGMSVFTLPGNPVSVYVSLHMLVRPALARMSGGSSITPRFIPARAASGWRCPPGRVQFIPVRVSGTEGGVLEVEPASAGGSGSHLIGTLARAEGLVRVPAEVDEIRQGDPVWFWEER